MFAGERKIAKAGEMIADDVVLEVRGRDHPWVSRGGIKLALTGMFAFSTAPLRLLTGAGLALSLASMAYIVSVLFEYFYWGIKVPGYTTLVVSIMFFSGIQLLALGIMSAYVGRIYDEVKQRPIYLLKKRTGQGLPDKAQEPRP